MIHIYPLNDEKEHDTKTTMCICCPRVEWEDPETGQVYSEGLVIHNSFDCRESVEAAEEILKNL